MAKQTDEDLTPEEQLAKDEAIAELLTALKQAKRKPRNFAIVANGNDVLSVMMQKKKFRDGPLRQERREEGGKQIYEGLCEGAGGSTLIFKFDGELPKFTPGRLRKFISETTGLVIKAQFAQQAAPVSSTIPKKK